MLPSNSCNEKTCPGFGAAFFAGLFMILVMLIASVAEAGVRVEIKRELPDETQTIIQTFEDDEDFQMWMGMKMEGEGCDPYVTDIRIIRNWEPETQKF